MVSSCITLDLITLVTSQAQEGMAAAPAPIPEANIGSPHMLPKQREMDGIIRQKTEVAARLSQLRNIPRPPLTDT